MDTGSTSTFQTRGTPNFFKRSTGKVQSNQIISELKVPRALWLGFRACADSW